MMKFYPDGTAPELPNMYFIYGDGGTGKTTIAKQFDGHKFIISFDLSSNVIRKDKDTDVLLLEHDDISRVQQLTEQIVTKAIANQKYQVIVLDNVTALQNFVLENIDNASKDNRQNYQKLQLWFRQLSTWLKESGKTIYATAHQVDFGSSGLDGGGRFAADLNEKTFNAFTSTFDVVGRIYLKDGKRLIDLDPENGNHAKNRLDERKIINAEDLIQKTNENEEK